MKEAALLVKNGAWIVNGSLGNINVQLTTWPPDQEKTKLTKKKQNSQYVNIHFCYLIN